MIARILNNTILELLEYFPVVAIVGPRQVGKTTLAKHLMKQIDKETVYLDLEYPEDLNKLDNAALYLEHYQTKCIIIDEIQRKPELFPILRSIIDRKRTPGRFILLGSASPKLIKDSSESLAGRIAYTELHTFNLLEISKEKTMQKHWFLGGFPNSILAPKEKYAQNWTKQFIQSYIERDLPILGFPATPKLSYRLWQMLAHYNGNIWNASSFANSLGISVPTVNKYIDFFEEAFLIRRLQAWHINAKKRLIKSPKIYLRDTGILHYLAGINSFDGLLGNAMLGASWEAYAIEQIYQLLPQEFGINYYRTSAGAEVDLVISKNIKPICCIEIKYTSAPKISAGFLNVIADLGTSQNYIITVNSENYPIKDNIEVNNLADFLKNIISVLGCE